MAERHGESAASAAAQGSNPHQPGYVPAFDPADGREVGQGVEFGADLYALYRAGRSELPKIAVGFAEMTSLVHDEAQRLSFLADSLGGHYVFYYLEGLRSDLHVALRGTAVAIQSTAEALVTIADDYARTDLAARDEFKHLMSTPLESKRYSEPTPQVPSVPAPGDPYSNTYEPPASSRPPVFPVVPEWVPFVGGETLIPHVHDHESPLSGIPERSS